MPDRVTVFHVVGVGAAQCDMPRLRSAWSAREENSRLLVVADRPVALHRALPAPSLVLPPLRRRETRRIDRALAEHVQSGAIAHLWSAAALPLAEPLASRGAKIIVECEHCASRGTLRNLRAFLDAAAVAKSPQWLRALCQSATAGARLAQCGVDPALIAVIGAAQIAQPPALTPHEARAALNLNPRQPVALISPGDLDDGPFHSTWAGLLVERVIPELILLVPARPGALPRAERLAHSAGRGPKLRYMDAAPFENAVSAADFAVDLSQGVFPLDYAAGALRAGLPLIARPSPELADLTSHYAGVSMQPAQTPAEAARAVLLLLDGHKSVAASRNPSVTNSVTPEMHYDRLYTEMSA